MSFAIPTLRPSDPLPVYRLSSDLVAVVYSMLYGIAGSPALTLA